MNSTKEFDLDLEKISRVYNHGSIIESRLIGWTNGAFKKWGKDLKNISGKVGHLGEGKWTIEAAQKLCRHAKKLCVPTPVIKAAFNFRVRSVKKPSYTGKVVTALRIMFGGPRKGGFINEKKK